MNRRWTITLLLLPVVVLSVLLLTRSLHTVPPDKCSDVYRQYKDTPGIKASFIKDYPINDTTTIDVTTLEASSDAGWESLKKTFNIIDYPPEVLPFVDTMVVEYYFATKDDYSRGMDSVRLNNDFIAVSRFMKKVTVFNIKEEKQIVAILSYNINKQKKNEN
jgi:hypothetical protein